MDLFWIKDHSILSIVSNIEDKRGNGIEVLEVCVRKLDIQSRIF